jgi:ribosomal protein S18 acetylase RimI-like enzyme
MSNIFVRDMRGKDLTQILSIHKQAFQGFFLERMGSTFLFNYYSILLAFSGSIALVAVDSETDVIEGFVVGFSRPEEFYSHFRSHRLKLMKSIFFGVLRRPSLLADIYRNTLRVNKQSVPNSFAPNACELTSIAVHSKSSGVGSSLLESFISRVWSAGTTRIDLTTDSNHNEYVHNFYIKYGFECSGNEMRHARAMTHYSLSRNESI